MAKFKQKCNQCYKNYVLVPRMQPYVVCYECQKKELAQEIEDPELKKLLDIPEKFYEKNSFLRSIKVNCIRYGKLTERQIEVFKKVVKQLEDEEKKES